MSEDTLGKCWNCGRELAKADYGREATCLGCAKPTRVCRNCRHFAPGRPNECVEPLVERVLDKENANFCELFDPSKEPAGVASPDADDLLKQAEDLFN
jgi:hypothetical protein